MIDDIFEDYAHSNGLSKTDPGVRLLLGVGAVCINALGTGLALSAFIAVSMAMITVGLARIPLNAYARLLTVPLFFAVTGTVIILFLTGGGADLVAYPAGPFTVTITEGGAYLAATVFMRTMAGMSALFFVALTVPATEIFSLLHRARVPAEIIDLAMLMYRYIFILIGEAIALYDAQVMRNGYRSLKNSVNAFSMLASTLFIRAWEKGEMVLVAMDSRCYSGRFGVLESEKTQSRTGFFLVVLYFAACGTILVTTRPAGVW